MKLKVCGMREPDNIAALSALQPDYMGFIFWAPSSRYVSETTLVLDKSIKKTGVFVDASVDYIQSSISAHQLQAVQLLLLGQTYARLVQQKHGPFQWRE